MKKVSFGCVYFACFALLQTAQAQTIRGRVVDAVSGEGIPEVTVEASLFCSAAHGQPGSTHVGTAKTLADGSFEANFPTMPVVCWFPYRFFQFSRPGYGFLPGRAVTPLEGEVIDVGSYFGTNQPLSNVSAANYARALAWESITTAFGNNLATISVAAEAAPLPTSLADRSVTVSDYHGVAKPAPLLFVSPDQINYILPAGLAEGAATVRVLDNGRVIRAGFIELQKVAPALFTANANGRGVAAAVVLRVKADGSQSYEPVAQFDPAQNRFVAVPIDLGPETDRIILVLFGTGWRYRSSEAEVNVRIGETDTQVQYAGAQPTIAGLDQINVVLPRSLAGRGEVNVLVSVQGKGANSVQLNIK